MVKNSVENEISFTVEIKHKENKKITDGKNVKGTVKEADDSVKNNIVIDGQNEPDINTIQTNINTINANITPANNRMKGISYNKLPQTSIVKTSKKYKPKSSALKNLIEKLKQSENFEVNNISKEIESTENYDDFYAVNDTSNMNLDNDTSSCTDNLSCLENRLTKCKGKTENKIESISNITYLPGLSQISKIPSKKETLFQNKNYSEEHLNSIKNQVVSSAKNFRSNLKESKNLMILNGNVSNEVTTSKVFNTKSLISPSSNLISDSTFSSIKNPKLLNLTAKARLSVQEIEENNDKFNEMKQEVTVIQDKLKRLTAKIKERNTNDIKRGNNCSDSFGELHGKIRGGKSCSVDNGWLKRINKSKKRKNRYFYNF